MVYPFSGPRLYGSLSLQVWQFIVFSQAWRFLIVNVFPVGSVIWYVFDVAAAIFSRCAEVITVPAPFRFPCRPLEIAKQCSALSPIPASFLAAKVAL